MFANPTTSFLKRCASALLASSVLLASPVFTGNAVAADMLEDGTYDASTPVEYGTGWYLRGEIGTNIDGLHNQSTSLSEVSDTFSNEVDYQDAIFGSVAVGRKLTSMLRGDLAVSFMSRQNSTIIKQIDATNCPGQYFRSVQVGSNPIISPVTGGIIGTTPVFDDRWVSGDITNCSEQTGIDHTASIVSANGYVDIGKFGRFSPFIGAGLGVARINYARTSSVTCIPGTPDTQRCLNDGNPVLGPAPEDGSSPAPSAGIPYQRPVRDDSGVSYHIAGSATAGVSYQVSPNLFFDTSYSYTHVFNSPLYDGTNGLDGADLDASNHQLKIGLRYEIW